MVDSLLKLEIDQIVWLQNACQPIEGVLEVFSTFTKSSQLNLYVLPFALAFDVRLFAVLTFVTSIASYVTTVLKWLLADSRPYWWVKITESYGQQTRPDLRQTELTCETSAGSPSGHVLLNAACWYVFVHYAVRLLQQRQAQQQIRGSTSNMIRWLKPLCWTMYAFGLCMVAVSRMYFACHYLHQCVLGAVLGWSLCHVLVQRNNGKAMYRLLGAGRLRLAGYFGVMVAVAAAVYFGQIAIGVDPLWSVRTAFNHCKDPLYVRPETTAVYCIVRDLGLFFGLVLIAPLSKYDLTLNVRLSLPAVSVLVIAYHFLADMVPRQHGVGLFYASTFALNASMVAGSIVAITKFCYARRRY